jgi:predicted nucleic acid-binding protein
MAEKRTVTSLTEPLFFDTDCLSAFLWVDKESILAKLYPGRIVIPSQVYNELSHPGLNHIKGLKAQIDTLVQSGQATVKSIIVGTKTYNLYYKLTQNPDPGHKIIGDGEAAAISMAKEYSGILASNNFRDISDYVQEYDLIHITTGAIMKEAMDAGLIDEQQGNAIWQNMIKRKRKLGYLSFSDYLKSNP